MLVQFGVAKRGWMLHVARLKITPWGAGTVTRSMCNRTIRVLTDRTDPQVTPPECQWCRFALRRLAARTEEQARRARPLFTEADQEEAGCDCPAPDPKPEGRPQAFARQVCDCAPVQVKATATGWRCCHCGERYQVVPL